MNNYEFENKSILITGAAGGFGTLLANHLAKSGARLFLSDYNHQGLDTLTDTLIQAGATVRSRAADIRNEAEVSHLAELAVSSYGSLDIAINNAGLSTPMKPLAETTEEEMDLNYAVNTKGVFFGMKYQIRQMVAQGGGTILNVASMAGLGGAPKIGAYCASKHAVVGLTKTAALEYASKNIRINAVCPYYSPTPLVTEGIDPALQELLAQGSPMKRLGAPEEIVQAMLMLIAPENSYLNGQAIAVDGGMSAR